MPIMPKSVCRLPDKFLPHPTMTNTRELYHNTVI